MLSSLHCSRCWRLSAPRCGRRAQNVLFCYCVDVGLKTVISTLADEIRARISSQRAQVKAIDHLSIPISTIANANPDFQQGVSFWHHDRIREFVEAKDLEFSTEEQRWDAYTRLRRSSRARC